MTQAHPSLEHQTQNIPPKSPTFYQQEQENPMTSPEQPEFHVELDRDKVKISGEISWQQLRSLRKPIVLLITHLTTAGITWASTLQNPPHPPTIAPNSPILMGKGSGIVAAVGGSNMTIPD
jgi:hypothetical protein